LRWALCAGGWALALGSLRWGLGSCAGLFALGAGIVAEPAAGLGDLRDALRRARLRLLGDRIFLFFQILYYLRLYIFVYTS